MNDDEMKAFLEELDRQQEGRVAASERARLGIPNDDDLRYEPQLFWWIVAALGGNPPLSVVLGQDYWTKGDVRGADWRIEGIGILKYEYRQQLGAVDIYVSSNRTSVISSPPPCTIEGVSLINEVNGGWRKYGFHAELALVQQPEVFRRLVAMLRDILTAPSERARLEWVSRLARPEQGAFRRRLLERDGKCVVTGTTVEAVLQAAHIEGHASGGSMSSENGILLRVDLHLLFDAGLLEFKDEGGRLVARFDQRVLADPHYQGLEGKVVEGLPAEVSERLPGRNVDPR